MSSKRSFNPDAQTETDAPAPAAETPIEAPETPTENLPVSASFFGGGQMTGEYDASDIQIPRLQLTHGVGSLAEHFQPGRLVYNKAHDLGSGPLSITLLKSNKYFMEEVEHGSEVIPRRFATLEEVRAAGLKPIQEKPRGEPKGVASYALPVLDAHILIEVPKGNAAEAEAFHQFGDKSYVEAILSLSKVNYSRVAKLFITASQLALRKGLHLRPWALSTKREKFSANFVWTLNAVMQPPHSAEQVAWIEKEVLQIAQG